MHELQVAVYKTPQILVLHRPIKKIHTEDKAQKYTMQASVTIETGHSGHIEDLLKKKKAPWQYYSLYTLRAETQTVTTLQEQETQHSTLSNNC